MTPIAYAYNHAWMDPCTNICRMNEVTWRDTQCVEQDERIAMIWFSYYFFFFFVCCTIIIIIITDSQQAILDDCHECCLRWFFVVVVFVWLTYKYERVEESHRRFCDKRITHIYTIINEMANRVVPMSHTYTYTANAATSFLWNLIKFTEKIWCNSIISSTNVVVVWTR